MVSGTIEMITFGIVGLIAVLTAFALVRRSLRIDNQAPAILTSLGIFGTFLGITVGLAAFDPADITRSVPQLFAGIQLAFWTSVAGILGGILIKLRCMIWPLAEQVQDQSVEQDRLVMRDMLSAMQGVQAHLSDEQRAAVLPQIKSALDQSNERGDKVLAAVQDLGSLLGDAANRDARTQEALHAIRDSNDSMSEQLRSMLSEQLAALGEGVNASGESTAQSVREATAAIGQLREVLGGDNTKLLSSLSALRDSTSGLSEQFAAGLSKLHEQMTSGGEQSAEQMQAMAKMLDSLREATRDSASGLGEQLGAGLAKLHDQMASGGAQSSEQMKAMAEMLKSLHAVTRDSAGGLGDQIGAGLAKLHEQLSSGGAQSAEQMQAVAESIKSLRGALGEEASQMLGQLSADSSALAERLAEAFGSSNEQLAGVLKAGQDKLGAALEGNRDVMAAQVTAAVSEIRDAIVGQDAVARKLGEQMQQSQLDLAAALARSSEQLREALGGQFEGLNAALSGSSQQAGEQLGAVVEAIDHLKQALGEDSGRMLAELKQGSDALGGLLRQSVAQLHETLGDQLAAVQTDLAQRGQASGEQVRAIVDAVTGLKQALGDDSEAMLKRLDGLREGSAELSQHLGQVLSDSQSALASSLRDSNQLLAGAIEGNRDAMAARIDQAVGQIRDALLGPEGAGALLGEGLQKGQLQLAQALARATESMEQGLSSQGQAMLDRIDGLNDGLAQLAESVSGSIGDSLGGYLGDSQKLASGIMDAIDDLRLAITGPDGSGTGLVDEIRSAQDQSNKALSSIRKALEENTKRQVDYSPKALMDVLEEAIRNFNTQFSGQFWDKFGAFNKAIGELNDYMNAYRKQLTDMVDQQSKTARNMDTATRRFDEVASRAEIFIDVSRNIQAMLGGLDSQRVQLEGHLKRFAHIVDATADNLENIEGRIIEGNASMNEHLGEIANRIEEQVIRVDSALDEELTKALNTFGQQLAALSEKFVDDYTPLTERLRDVVNLAKAGNGHAAQ